MTQEQGSKFVPTDDTEKRPTDKNKAKDSRRNAKLPLSDNAYYNCSSKVKAKV